MEIYDLPMAGFGALVASVAPPLAIGTVELADGEAVKGFLCESYAAACARDITDFGGWVAFLERLRQRRPARAGHERTDRGTHERCAGLPLRAWQVAWSQAADGILARRAGAAGAWRLLVRPAAASGVTTR